VPEPLATPSPAGVAPPPRPRVSLVGPVNIDLFIRGRAPLDQALLEGWVGPADVDLVVAGSIGYTAQAFARLGERVELHSCVGDDAFGAHIRRSLLDAGIEERFLVQARGATAIAIYVLLFGGHKRPMTYRLPDFEPWPDPLPAVRPGEPLPDLVHSGGLLHFPAMWHRGLAPAFAAARAAGILTAIDPQFPLLDTPAPWLPHVADALAEADVLLCDDGELRRLFAVEDLRDGLAAAHGAGPRTVVVKRGARGALASDGRSVLDQPAVAIPEEQVREAVGAGDAFDAGFLDSLVRGGDLPQALRFGTSAAALTLSGRGGSESITGREAVEISLDRVPPARTWRGD
jgi:sugar/nucleoside kinase (ribokinase family)